MIGTPATLIGMAGAALLLASATPDGLSIGQDLFSSGYAIASVTKTDRLHVPAVAAERSTVSTVEVVGISHARVVLRDRNGVVLYQSDPLTNTTLVAKNVDLPVVTLKENVGSPVVQQPVEKREGNEPPTTKGRKSRMPGCEGAVSPLANRDGPQQGPGLCLAALDVLPQRS